MILATVFVSALPIALEDERDLSKVFMRMDLFEAYVRGYVGTVGKVSRRPSWKAW